MANEQKLAYNPDYAVVPGETLQETLETFGMSQVDLCRRTGISTKHINRIIKGKEAITPETALKLERALGVPASFWNSLEKNYRDRLLRFAEKVGMESEEKWIKLFPYAEMVRFGWIRGRVNIHGKYNALLDYFRVANPEQWNKVWATMAVAFRKAELSKDRTGAITAWLRRGEIMAREITSVNEFDPAKFKEIQSSIRKLTCETAPDEFIPKLQTACAGCGVLVVFVRELSGTGVYGATRWVNANPIIQLSARYKTNDNLWFTFFHEAGHILKHGRKDIFLEPVGKTEKDEKEKDADRYACNTLIPAADYDRFVSLKKHSRLEINKFADSIGVAPGIVVGRLNHDGILAWNQRQDLKIHYRWN